MRGPARIGGRNRPGELARQHPLAPLDLIEQVLEFDVGPKSTVGRRRRADPDFDVAIGLHDEVKGNGPLPGPQGSLPRADQFRSRHELGWRRRGRPGAVGLERLGVLREQHRGDVLGDGKRVAATIGQCHDREVVGWEEVQDRGHARHTPAVLDQVVAPRIGMIDPAEPVRLSGITEGVHGIGTMHRVDRRIGQNRALVGQMVLEMEHPEPNQIVGARVDRRSAVMIEGIERDRSPAAIVPLGRIGFEPGADVDRRMGHAQRKEDLFPHEFGVGEA